MAPSVPPIPVLDLSTLVDRPFIRIDGTNYDIRHPDEFSLVQQLRQQRQAERVMLLVQAMVEKQASTADEEEYVSILDQSCRAVLIAPDAIHEKLRDDHRLAIVKAFTELLLEKTRKRAEATPPDQPPSTNSGTATSLDSPASTMEIPSGG